MKFGLTATVVAAVAMAAFAPSLLNGFTFDDAFVVSANPGLERLRSPAAYVSRDYFDLSGEATWRPVVTASYALDFALWGQSPRGYHLTNLLWHAAAVVAWLFAFRSLGASARVSALAAVIYATHPVQSEAVCGVGFREDLQCAAFYGMALALWPAGGAIRREAPARRHGRYVAALLCFVLAALAKEMALSFPLLALAKVAGRGPQGDAKSRGNGRTGRWSGEEAGWLCAAGIVAAGLAALSVGWTPAIRPENPYAEAPPGVRLAAFPWIVAQYLRLLAFPWPLSVEHVVPMEGHAFWIASGCALAGLLALGSVSVLARRRFPAGLEAFVAFFVLLAPVSNLVPIYNPMAERYLTLPLAAFAWTMAHALDAGIRGLERRRGRQAGRWAAIGLCAGMVALYGALDWRRAADWRSSESLWGAEVARNSPSPRAWLNYAVALAESGKFRQALPPIERAQTMASDHPRILNTLGWICNEFGRFAQARAALEKAIALQPDLGEAHLNLAVSLAGLNNRPAALRHARRAVELLPHSEAARRNLDRLQAAPER
mgnify:CR=1 FL=1